MDADQRSQITAGILAGGESRRMQGVDKGLVKLLGKPLISYTIDLIKPQVGGIIINANRHTAAYDAFGYPIIKDDFSGHEGPLAGIAACMAASRTSLLVCVPCDSPTFPDDLVDRLHRNLCDNDAEICIAHDGSRTQPVFALLKTALLGSLQDFLASGERKTDKWYETHKVVESDFSDKGHLFININNEEDLTKAENYLSGSHD